MMLFLLLQNYNCLEYNLLRMHMVNMITMIPIMMLFCIDVIDRVLNVKVDRDPLISGLILLTVGFIGVKIFYCLLTVRFWIKDSGTVNFSQIG